MSLTPGHSLSFYEILGPLGAGAMGEVYRAKDTRLDREVAIKVLPTHFAEDEDRLRRFEREAKSIASLNHPNVAQIYSVDQVDDTCFLVLELVPGETLEDRIARGPLPPDEAIDVCGQIADGLEAAHDAGVIHRDLKPANVRITPDGKVKVLDFGLAKPTGPNTESDSTTDSVLATEAGRLLGTPTYMAPEQARGKPIDRRVDVWAFGCVLYECLTAERAFAGETIPDVLATVLQDEPDWERLPVSTPAHVRELIERCVEKDPRQRLRDIGDARLELTRTRDAETPRPASSATAVRVRRFALVGIALALAGGGWVVWDGARSGGIEGPGAMGAIGAIDSIAVLPFVNQSNDPGVDFLGDGIAENVINSLANLPSLRVVSRNTAFRQRGREDELETVAAELDVRVIVTGRVSRRGDQLIVGVELTDVVQQSQLWGHRFDTSIDDILTVESTIASQITDALRIKLSREQAEQIDKHVTQVPAAHLALMEGRYSWNTRTLTGFRAALDLYDKAIAADPGFALAHAYKAETYALMMLYIGSPDDYEPLLRLEVAAALRLDPNLPQAYPVQGFLLILELDWEGADAAFRRAIDLKPDYATAHHWYSVMFSAIGNLEEGLRRKKEARRLDPGSLIIAHDIAASLMMLDRLAEAEVIYNEVREASPTFWRPLEGLGLLYTRAGRFEDAIRSFERAQEITGEIAWVDGLVAWAYGNAGDLDRARQELQRMEERAANGSYVSPFGFARAYLGLGDMDRCFEWLDRAVTERDPLFVAGVFRNYPAILADPRWPALEQRMNYPK